MRYGKQMTISVKGNVVQYDEEKYHDWAKAYTITRYSESVQVRNENDVHAEFLKLLDRHKTGEICDIGIYTYTDKDGKLNRAEKVWTVKSLH